MILPWKNITSTCNKLLLIGLLAGCFLLMSNKQDKQFVIQFHHFVGDQSVILDDTIVNLFGEKMVVRKFRYYISNVVLVTSDGKRASIPNSYFLIDEADSGSKSVSLPQPSKSIMAIEFILGVDSLRNCSGIQTGVLDPMHGMFWTWNTGYIFAKLEGNAPVAQSAAHSFTYHIGGFKYGQNAMRKIQLPLQDNKPQKTIHIKVDINAWFKGKEEIHIATIPICHSPGKLAMRFADNYAQMFSIMQQ